MARINIKYRRRHEKKTDYQARMEMLKSEFPRLIIRKTNKYIIAEIAGSKEAQDFVMCYANSKELQKLGWNLSMKNIPAAYLTGCLIASKAKKKNIKKVIVDLGIQRSTKGSKLYAVIKGAKDNGLDINCSAEIMPSEDRIKGKHLAKKDNIEELIKKVKERIAGK